MKRRVFLAAVGGAAAWPLVARAEQVRKVYQIGVLLPGTPATFARRTNAFLEGMRTLGYVGPNRRANSMHRDGGGWRIAELCGASHLLGNDARFADASPRRTDQGKAVVNKQESLGAKRRWPKVKPNQPPDPPTTLGNMREPLDQRQGNR